MCLVMSLDCSYISRNCLLKSQSIFRRLSLKMSSNPNFLCIYLVKPLEFLVSPRIPSNVYISHKCLRNQPQ